MDKNRTLPDDCQLKEAGHKLRDMILAMNEKLEQEFGAHGKLDVQRVNPESADYKEDGLLWFVILPWPQINGEEFKKFMSRTVEIQSFEPAPGWKVFGFMRTAAGGVLTLILGLQKKQPVSN